MSFAFYFLLAVLATYRVAQAVSLDKVFEPVRVVVGRQAAKKQQPRRFWAGFAYWINCPFCVGVWVAIPFSIIALKPIAASDLLLLWLAVAGGQAFLESLRQ